jgi:glucosyl-3-phosphoglycerate synthase
VTSLPRLRSRSVEELESALLELVPKFPVSLVVPMIPGEMDRPALGRIVDELSRTTYLQTLLVSLNKATLEDYHRTVAYFERYPGRKVILWSESPGVQAFLGGLAQAGLGVGQPGKGRACWLAMGYLLAEEKVDYMAFQDADVVNFSREMTARLLLPALDPIVDFDFVKAYYARVSDRLHGRVTRLYVSPLLAAFTRLIGDHAYIRYLSSFRYALSGEFAVQRDLASRMRLPSDWGLEIVSLFEALRHRAPARMCQVEIADRYDHKHQELSAEDATRGLNRMARDIGTHLLRTLAAAGVEISEGRLKSLLAAYQREAEDAVADSYAVAWINGLRYDRHEEEIHLQTFAAALQGSIQEFLADPLGPPLVPNWARVWAGVHDAGPRLLAAVAQGPG